MIISWKFKNVKVKLGDVRQKFHFSMLYMEINILLDAFPWQIQRKAYYQARLPYYYGTTILTYALEINLSHNSNAFLTGVIVFNVNIDSINQKHRLFARIGDGRYIYVFVPLKHEVIVCISSNFGSSNF